MNLKIFLNGRVKTVTPAQFEQLLPGSLEGEGAFETMRMYDGKVFAFEEHIKRLRRGLKHFGLPLPYSPERLRAIISRVSRLNRLPDSRVRIIIWKTGSRRYISVSCQPLNLPSPDKYREGYRVMTSDHVRNRNQHSHVKSIDYRMLKAVFREAQEKGFDEALVLNQEGDVVEGTRTNIFCATKGVLYTPSTRCGALNGITRRKLLECARVLGIRVHLTRVRLPMLLKAEEAFLTGSTLEIMPVRSVNGRPIGKKWPGPLTARLTSAYKSLVARSITEA